MQEMNEEYPGIIELFQNNTIPEAFPPTVNPLDFSMFSPNCNIVDFEELMERSKFIKLCGYVMITYNWIRPLAAWIGKRKCLEVMCGSGALSKALQDCGVSVIATDKDKSWKPWIDIEYIDCLEAIEKYGRNIDVLICSWPPFEDNISYDLLLKIRQVNPEMMMIYIGELGGSTACDEFHNNIIHIDDSAFNKAIENFTQIHYTIHDYPYLVK